MIKALILSLALTLACEVSGAAVCGVRGKNDLAIVALANVMTNPAAVLTQIAVTLYVPRFSVVSLLLIELAAFLAEWYVYGKYLSFRKIPPLILSLILNCFSFLSGELLKILL